MDVQVFGYEHQFWKYLWCSGESLIYNEIAKIGVGGWIIINQPQNEYAINVQWITQ